MAVVHRVAMKRLVMFRRVFATRRQRSVIAVPEIEVMIDMSVKMFGSVKPRAGPYKDAA